MQPGVGKTSLLMHYVEGSFPKDAMPTIGASFMTRNLFVFVF